jgi:uncharacterized membrane protein YkgB
LKKQYYQYEKRLSNYLRKRSIFLLRISLGIIFFWYGALKVMGISPVEELVERATDWIGAKDFVFFLGIWEMAIGLCLFSRKLRRIGLILLFLQFPGTFLPLFTNPEDCFTVIPYGLTLEGQYVFKNLVLISAALVLVGSLHNGERALPSDSPM